MVAAVASPMHMSFSQRDFPLVSQGTASIRGKSQNRMAPMPRSKSRSASISARDRRAPEGWTLCDDMPLEGWVLCDRADALAAQSAVEGILTPAEARKAREAQEAQEARQAVERALQELQEMEDIEETRRVERLRRQSRQQRQPEGSDVPIDDVEANQATPANQARPERRIEHKAEEEPADRRPKSSGRPAAPPREAVQEGASGQAEAAQPRKVKSRVDRKGCDAEAGSKAPEGGEDSDSGPGRNARRRRRGRD